MLNKIKSLRNTANFIPYFALYSISTGLYLFTFRGSDLIFNNLTAIVGVGVYSAIFSVVFHLRKYSLSKTMLFLGSSSLYVGLGFVPLALCSSHNDVPNIALIGETAWLGLRMLEAALVYITLGMVCRLIHIRVAIALATLLFVALVYVDAASCYGLPLPFSLEIVTRSAVIAEHILAALFLIACILLLLARKKIDRKVLILSLLAIFGRAVTDFIYALPWYNQDSYWDFVASVTLLLSAVATYQAIISIGVIKTLNHYTHVLFQENVELQARERELIRISERDALTGALTRRKYQSIISDLLSRDNRFSLCVVDMDYFKKVNDQYGHKAGDRMLTEFVTLVTRYLLNKDYLIRYAGDEFVLIFVDDDVVNAEKAVQRIQRVISNHRFCGAHSLVVSCSYGIAERRAEDSEHSLFERADAAMYEAKQAGRNLIRVAGT